MLGAREVELSPLTPVALLLLADVKTALGITGGAQDTEVTALIAEVSASVEAYCGAIFGQRDVTERLHLEEGGGSIVLRYAPAHTLASVTVENDAKPTIEYRLNRSHGTLRRVDGYGFGTGEHVIVYKAGFATVDIPAGVTRAALELAKYLYTSKGENDDVARDSVADVGETEYRDTKERTMTVNGIALPSRIALMLAPHKLEFFL